MLKIKLSVACVLVLLLFVVVFQNTDSDEIRFLIWTVAMPRALLVFLSVLAGFALGLFGALGLSSSRGRREASR